MTVAAISPGLTGPATAADLRRLARSPDEDPGGLTPDELYRSALYGGVTSLAGAAGPTIYVHEKGHALAAEALFQGANPTIEITPFKGGVTRWRPGPLTPLGEKLGVQGSRALVSGAGALADIALATGAFAIGYRIRKKHPRVGAALMGLAGWTIANDALYAASALTIGRSLPALARAGHDFAALAVHGGIHPVVSIAILAAVLPAEYALLRYLEKQGV